MAQRKLLTNGSAFLRTDGRWCGVVWYMDEHGERKRKSFFGTSKAEVNKKMTDYVAAFDKMVAESDESKKTLQESMDNWLRVFKFPSVERGSYDRLECTAKHQVYPLIGKKIVGDVTSADIQKLLNHWMNEGYAYNTVKKVYNLLTDYFRYLTQQEYIAKNPMTATPMIKKANFMAAQGKENLPTFETVTTFTPEEIERFKSEAYRTWSNGERIYQQASAYTLMFNTGLRTGKVLGLLNSDIDLSNKVMHLQRGVKEDSPLIHNKNGDYTRPVNFRRRYYRILEAAGIEKKGLHSIRHTFATNLVNGIKQPDGTIRSLTPRQVADLFGHSTSEITELYYVRKDTSRLSGITNGFEL